MRLGRGRNPGAATSGRRPGPLGANCAMKLRQILRCVILLLSTYVVVLGVVAPTIMPGILLVALMALVVHWVFRAVKGDVRLSVLLPRALMASLAVIVIGRPLFLVVEIMSHDTSLDVYAGAAILGALALIWLGGLYGIGRIARRIIIQRRPHENAQQ